MKKLFLLLVGCIFVHTSIVNAIDLIYSNTGIESYGVAIPPSISSQELDKYIQNAIEICKNTQGENIYSCNWNVCKKIYTNLKLSESVIDYLISKDDGFRYTFLSGVDDKLLEYIINRNHGYLHVIASPENIKSLITKTSSKSNSYYGPGKENGIYIHLSYGDFVNYINTLRKESDQDMLDIIQTKWYNGNFIINDGKLSEEEKKQINVIIENNTFVCNESGDYTINYSNYDILEQGLLRGCKINEIIIDHISDGVDENLLDSILQAKIIKFTSVNNGLLEFFNRIDLYTGEITLSIGFGGSQLKTVAPYFKNFKGTLNIVYCCNNYSLNDLKILGNFKGVNLFFKDEIDFRCDIREGGSILNSCYKFDEIIKNDPIWENNIIYTLSPYKEGGSENLKEDYIKTSITDTNISKSVYVQESPWDLGLTIYSPLNWNEIVKRIYIIFLGLPLILWIFIRNKKIRLKIIIFTNFMLIVFSFLWLSEECSGANYFGCIDRLVPMAVLIIYGISIIVNFVRLSTSDEKK